MQSMDMSTKREMAHCVPLREEDQSKYPRWLSHSLHIICKADEVPVDTRPPSVRGKCKEKVKFNESKKVRFAFQNRRLCAIKHS
jgi:hypothetical protein